MKIFNIQHNYINKFAAKTSFCSNENTPKKRVDENELLYNNAYNTEYTPLNYEKTTMVRGRPGVLPSERMFRQNRSSFRDDELFNYGIDPVDFVPKKYDRDEVPLDFYLLTRPFKKIIKNYAPDTYIPAESFGDCYNALYNPWKDELTLKAEKEQEEYEELMYEELRHIDKADSNTIKKIFKSSSILTGEKEKLNSKLCNLAIRLYRNSNTWDETEKAIMDEIRIPIYKKVYGDYSIKKCKYIDLCLKAGYSNEDILDFLYDFCPGYVLDLRPIMTEEEVKAYNNEVRHN